MHSKLFHLNLRLRLTPKVIKILLNSEKKRRDSMRRNIINANHVPKIQFNIAKRDPANILQNSADRSEFFQ